MPLMDLPRMEPREAAMLNPLQLAYMGDSVWEMIVRNRLILQRRNVHHMHTECVRTVNAGAQARAMRLLQPFLTEEEKAILTDACKILVLKGEQVHLVEGDVSNIKITYPADIRIADSLIGGR